MDSANITVVPRQSVPSRQRADSPATTPHLPYAPAIDGLRAISVIAVMLWHNNPLGVVKGGFLGVEVFFVISGYLITSLLFAEFHAQSRVSLRNFYLRRARRLLPALFVMLAVVTAYSVVFLRSDSQSLGSEVLSALTYTTNWLFVARHVSYVTALGRPPLLQHLWSLAVEEQFYLVWPLLFVGVMRAARGRRGPVIAAIVGLAAMSASWMWVLYKPYNDPSRVYFGSDSHAAGLLLGAAFALFWRPDRLTTRTGNGAPAVLDLLGLLGLAGLAAFLFEANFFDEFLYHGGFVMLALVTLVVVGVAVHPASRIVRGALGWRPLEWIGKRSYGLYLWHWPIFMVTRPRVDVPIEGAPLLALRLGLTTLAAYLSYRYVEQPVRSGGLTRLRAQLRATGDAFGRDQLRRRVQFGLIASIVVIVALGGGLASLSGESAHATGTVSSVPISKRTSVSLAVTTSTAPSGGTAPPPVPLPRRVVIVGDSVGHFAYANRPNGLAPYLTLTDASTEGCGIVEGKMTSSIGYRRDLGAECHGWETKWSDGARAAHAQIALVFIGAWEVFDLQVDGKSLTFGSADWDQYFDAQLEKGIDALKSAGSQVALEEIPCWRPIDNGSGTTAFPERGDDARTRHVNELLEAAAAADPQHVFALSAPPEFCTDPEVATSLAERWDGVHYGTEGAARLFAQVTPQLIAIPVH